MRPRAVMEQQSGNGAPVAVVWACCTVRVSLADGQLCRPEHITWDEQTIAEHDLLRGTRMKIDEPKTPYEHRVLSGVWQLAGHARRWHLALTDCMVVHR